MAFNQQSQSTLYDSYSTLSAIILEDCGLMNLNARLDRLNIQSETCIGQATCEKCGDIIHKFYLHTTTRKEPVRFTDSFACGCTDPTPSMRSLQLAHSTAHPDGPHLSSPTMIKIVHPDLANIRGGPLTMPSTITGRLSVAQLCHGGGGPHLIWVYAGAQWTILEPPNYP